jgi:hypothetical protein
MARLRCDDDEKLVHMLLTASLSSTGSASRDWDKDQGEMFGPGRETYRYAPAVASNLSLHRPFSDASRIAFSQEGAGVLWARPFE